MYSVQGVHRDGGRAPRGGRTQAPCCRRLMRGAAGWGARGGGGVQIRSPFPRLLRLPPGPRGRGLGRCRMAEQRGTGHGGTPGVPHTAGPCLSTPRPREQFKTGGCFQHLPEPPGVAGEPQSRLAGPGLPGSCVNLGRGDAGDTGGEGGPAAAERSRAERGAHASEDAAGRPVQEMKASSLGAHSGAGSASLLDERPSGSFLGAPPGSPAPTRALHPPASVGEAPAAGARPPARPCPRPALNAPR